MKTYLVTGGAGFIGSTFIICFANMIMKSELSM